MSVNLADQLALLALHVGGIIPELCVGVGLLAVLSADLLLSALKAPARAWVLTGIAVSACLGAGFFALNVLYRTPAGTMDDLFSNTLLFDRKALVAQIIILAGTVGVQLLAWEYPPLWKKDETDLKRNGQAEFHIMILGAVLGCMILVRANHWLLIYLALECISLSSYVLTAFKRDDPFSAEASVKFFLYGSFASAVMLFGVSLQYGMTGSMFLFPSDIPEGQPVSAVLFTYLLILTGIGYKISLVPFHFWLPDALQGAVMPVSAFISTVPKVAGFVWLARWVSATESDGNPMFFILAGLAVLSMVWGNLAAFGQTSFKRMMAYSGIAHTGYLTAAVLTGEKNYHALALYLALYVILNLAAFAGGMALTVATGSENMTDWRGKGWLTPMTTLCLTIALLALTGLPPTAGFLAKLQLFIALIGESGESHWFLVLAVSILLNTVASLFYYIKAPTELILKKPIEGVNIPLTPLPMLLKIIMVVLSILSLVALFFWGNAWVGFFGGKGIICFM